MTVSFVDRLRQRAPVWAGWAAAALGLSIPVSTTADSVLLVLLVVLWAACGKVSERLHAGLRHPAVVIGGVFFLLILAGSLHGDSPFNNRIKILSKYEDFLLPAIFLPVFADNEVRKRAVRAFGLISGVILLLSLMLAAGLIEGGGWVHGGQDDASIFKLRITHSVFMAFAAFLFALEAERETEWWKRSGLWSMSVLAGVNVFLFVKSQTGQMVFLALVMYWCWRRFGLKGIAVGICAALVVVIVSFQVSSAFRDRIEKSLYQAGVIETHRPDLVDQSVSVSLRLGWYKDAVTIIEAHPLVGVGTGSFSYAHAQLGAEKALHSLAHPHNQYLLTAAELGVPGLLGLLAVFAGFWRLTCHVADPFYQQFGQGVLILTTVGCLTNSLLLDHAEGLFFIWALCIGLAGMKPIRHAVAC
jgi:O-antigen ligase